jgi:GTP-binding protein EngB required for normal cell division
MQPKSPLHETSADRPIGSSRHSGMPGDVLQTISLLSSRYQITALDDFIESCRSFAEEEILNIAVLGRFKTGKSSFLNQLLGRSVLPVGVVPVTAVVIEIEYGPEDRVEIRFLNGRTETVPLDRVGEFVAEEGNPGNAKRVDIVRIELPSMEKYRGIRFVDTPGLESALEHNTAAAMEWLPNVGLAIVAVGADVPLSQHDIEFIRNLARYTPNISVLLTKVDILDAVQLQQVVHFIELQIERHLSQAVTIFPYSIRPGFETLRSKLEEALLMNVQRGAHQEQESILRHKLASLTNECIDYLTVSLVSAETADSEKAELRAKILGQKESLDDMRTALKLVVGHAAGATRSGFEDLLRKDEISIKQRLLARLENEFPSWTRSLAAATNAFDDWLRAAVTEEMSQLSKAHEAEFIEPARRVSRQLSQSLQDFRNRLSERMLTILGVPLRTTEMDLHAEQPRSPDVRVGKIFDRNWELISFVIPMTFVRGILKRHFRRKVEDVVFMNLSRLASQWEEIVNTALFALQAQSMRRLDNLISTIEKLLEMAGQEAPRIRADLETLKALRIQLRGQEPAS